MSAFANWTKAEVDAHNAKIERRGKHDPMFEEPNDDAQGLGKPIEREADLHNQIIEECKKRQWICLHGSMAQATGRTVGEWDFTLVASRGKVYFIECKKKGGKLTTEQLGMITWARALGHTVEVCYSFEQFLAIVNA